MAAVLFLIDELEVGGAQRQILLLAGALRQGGHRVALGYFRDANAVLRPAFEAAGVEVSLIRKTRAVDPPFVLRLARFLAAHRGWPTLAFGYTASLWARVAGGAAVACIRDLAYLPRDSRLLAGAERLLSRRSPWVVANSQVTADSMVARGIIPRAKLLVIPNAVEDEARAPRDAARARLRAICGGPESGAIVGTLARLVAVKDLATLVRAARLVVDRLPGARFVIGGEGPERPGLERLRDELALGGALFLPGTLAGREIIAGLDVAVLTSTSEGMPNFVLEAMVAAVPVVSTRAGAAAELLEEGRLGRLIATGDHRALAEGIFAALADPGPVAEAAYKVRAMSPASIAERYLALFPR